MFICNTCKKTFKNRSHGRPKYCSVQCKKNGVWGKVIGRWNKGRKLSREHKMKLSKKTLKGKNSLFWKGGKPSCMDCGKICSTYRAKFCIKCYISNYRDVEGLRRGGLNSRKILSLKKPTSIEVKLYKELKKRGLLFEMQYKINNKFLVDAYIPSLNLIIEADGDYWHNLDKVKKKDRAENAYLIKCGYNLLRLSEAEINNTSFGERRIQKFQQ